LYVLEEAEVEDLVPMLSVLVLAAAVAVVVSLGKITSLLFLEPFTT
jgi:hypothetical protein